MKRVFLLCMASLFLMAFILWAEESPLATRVEHFFLVSDRAQSLFTYFKDTFQLPEVWPFSQHERFSSGGLSLGNAVLEFVKAEWEWPKDAKPLKTVFYGIAFEPTLDTDATAAELTKRNIPLQTPPPSKFQTDDRKQVLWENIGLPALPPTNADIFFCDYKDRQAVAQRRKEASAELAKRMGGPLGVVAVAEITVGVQDLKEARSQWSALLKPSPQISDDAFVFTAGPRIHLVRAESPGIQGIVLSVRSVDQAVKFLEERQWLAKDDAGHIAISPGAIDGLAIRLTASTQAQEPANPLLGTGRGVDHVGIVVRNLEKTINDYEQMLGFKYFKAPPFTDGTVRSAIFFENSSYLELFSVANVTDETKYFAAFAEKHEGAIYLGLATSSAKDAVDYLKAHNFEAVLRGEESPTKEGQPKQAPPPYYYVFISDKPSGEKQPFMLSNVLFFIEYVSPGRLAALREQGMMAHPNTALGIRTVWFAVRDLDAQLRNLHDAGLESGETREAKFLGASGREVKAGNGNMLLLQSADKNSVLNTFLSNHDDGSIIAVSIEVSDLNKARSWVEGHSGHKLEPYVGYYGRCIMIPPNLTHGIWMEFFQR
jgi:catechol 2,3-dioxygenase-like lactoylglutathione lyase family enzyme